jgi:hypothetical protein
MPIDRERLARLIDDARFFLNEIEGHAIDVVPDEAELREQFEQEARNACDQLDAQASGIRRELGEAGSGD